MRQAAARVRTAELTRAMRDARFNGAQIQQGDVLAMSDGKLLSHGRDLEQALIEAVRGLGAGEGDLVTLYYGAELTEDAARAHQQLLLREFPTCEIEVYYGGQPIYLYLISVE